jgi:hydroxyethylthiazole kinase-like uncharacterized protein yjeF
MRRAHTVAQVRRAERELMARLPEGTLMQRAATGLAVAISNFLGYSYGARVVLLVGSGDNGGDALFAAAELASGGADVRIVAAGPRLHEAAAEAAHSAGATALDPDADPVLVDRAIDEADVILDGILGIGAAGSPALRGRARDIVARVRERLARQAEGGRDAGDARHPLVVAVDLPSGISPDDGAVPDPTVLTADVTVTFGAVKAGLLVPPGSEHAGRIVFVDLGLGPALAGVEPAVRMRSGA